MLQNRVNPSGEIIRTPHRGLWLGNRGVLHNEKQEIIRSYKIKAWITCVLEFRGRHREVMQPNRWTELFFLDEATAYAAGHRPCFQCRYEDHQRFKTYWLKGNPEYRFDMKTPVSKIDDILHQERVTSNKIKVTWREKLADLPDGTFVIYQDQAYLLKDTQLHFWTPAGYEKSMPLPDLDKITVLTPKSVVNMFRAGYVPQTGI
ncbi:hypothetical protein [Pedobacter miscanthi]|uniref:Uncharacterized protein n=1 Tax=Pedobacter miscanthi TaxID=2259170 RepID=A0A366KRB2_9SPHI|nr:hypothetical protein [Pedobacter miscanthi]RBQ03342.1 hypothetical protein DRW42_22465 [Pedobacter miscanthi]